MSKKLHLLELLHKEMLIVAWGGVYENKQNYCGDNEDVVVDREIVFIFFRDFLDILRHFVFIICIIKAHFLMTVKKKLVSKFFFFVCFQKVNDAVLWREEWTRVQPLHAVWNAVVEYRTNK